MRRKSSSAPQPDPLAAIEVRQQAVEDRLSREITSMRKAVDEAVSAESQRVDALLANSRRQTNEALTAAVERQSAEIVKACKDLEQRRSETTDRASTVLESKIQQLHQELTNSVIESNERQQAIIKQMTDLAHSTREDVSQLEARSVADGQRWEEISQRLQKQEADYKSGHQHSQTQHEELNVKLLELTTKTQELKEESSKALKSSSDQFNGLQIQHEQLRERLSETATQLDGLKGDTEINRSHASEQISSLVNDVRSQRDDLQSTIWSLSNMYTRSMTWRIKSFRMRLFDMLQSHDHRLQSPEFCLCSQPQMLLELIPSQERAHSSSLSGNVPSLPLPGSFAVVLWAQPGMRLSFRLTAGEGAAATSQRYEHTFEHDGQEDPFGRVSFAAPNLCQLDHVWNKEADTVQLGLELLELRFAQLASSGNTLNMTPAGATEHLADHDRSMDLAVTQTPDELTLTRYLTTETQLQDKLRGDLHALRNRSVRRVEWKLQGCTRMLELCRVGDAVDSPVFSAAGLDRLQLHFYPLGCDTGTATSHAQPCSLFVSGPARLTLKGVLWVGSNSRHFEHRYTRKGEVGGRGRVCTLEPQLDCHDSVNLALEIIEVETEIPEQNGTLCLREARPGSLAPGTAGNAPAPMTGTKGSLQMRREDPTKVDELVKCVSLPTLNTRTHFLPAATRGRRHM